MSEMRIERTLFFACDEAMMFASAGVVTAAKLRHQDCPHRNVYGRNLGDRVDEIHICTCKCHGGKDVGEEG